MPPDPKTTAQQIRSEVIADEVRRTGRLQRALQEAKQAISVDLNALMAQIEVRSKSGLPVDGGWLWQQSRLRQALGLIEDRLDAFGKLALSATEAGQTAALDRTPTDIDAMFRSLRIPPGSYKLINTRALDRLIGHFADGSPIRTYFERYGDSVASGIERKLIGGVLRGAGPRETARKILAEVRRQVEDAAEKKGLRAIATARTETLRVYREATIDGYAENSQLVDGYIRLATLDHRTCPVCLALSGTWSPLSDPFESHVSCRCTLVPSMRSMPMDYGQSGAQWFDDQDEEIQVQVLGPGKYELFKNKQLQLRDLIRRSTSPTFGPQVREASLREILQLRQAA